ncbi:alpha/beta hydrolase family protein [Nocardioides iriomotensis]|uniref:Peptidase S9 n=1 Tax=Nocardioides iriomotensis TaxID=715784 RepID=A0A4Q5IX08_9ACTN|nr:prolyl oligopeptidase family serine peptidase [Nocardioides iriomotensis]RYU09471.1 peptidase S9 [Nocardioides iriomotensis]
MTSRITRLVPVLLLAALVLGACASQPPVRSATPAGARVAPVLLGAHNDTSTPFNLVSVPALTRHRYDGRALRLDRVLTRTLAFTRYAVSYRSGGMIERERVTLAENGFVAFQIDYRNHGGSTRESGDVVARPLGYPEDLVNAVRAVRRARLPFVDATRVGLLGRSMGGGVVLNALAARPRLAQAAVLYSPVSSSAVDTYRRWVRPDPVLRARVTEVYGSSATRPGFWATASARTYLDRLDLPVQIHHGTADDVCPVRWSRATAAALRAGGNRDVTLYEYAGEDHRFGPAWGRFMNRAVIFLRAELA